MYEEDDEYIDFCNKVDLHIFDEVNSMENVVSIAAEHGFRGIVTNLGNIEYLVKEINKPLYGDKNIVPICVLDYPFGSSSMDVRTYSILSAKEKGAKEVEIVTPYYLLQKRDFGSILNDAKNIVNVCKNKGIGVKYVIDQNSNYFSDDVRTRFTRVIDAAKIPAISTSLGFFDEKISHSDNIIRMRGIKSKINALVKMYIKECEIDDFASYIKAGTDIVGLNWKKAPFLVHAYEEMLQKKI